MNTLLSITDLHVNYGRRNRIVRAADGVTFDVGEGEIVGLVGESGSGKSTIGRAVVGLAPVTSGSVVFDDEEIGHASRPARRRLSAHIQMIFQDPFSSLNPARTVEQTLLEPMLVHTPKASRAELSARVAEVLKMVDLPASAAGRYPAQFSGGQRQRIAIARSLVLSPRLVICDEPVSSLDLSIQAQILNLLVDLRAAMGVAYLLVAHDLAVVRHVAERVVVLYKGRIMESGPTELITDHPCHPYTLALTAAAPVPNPSIQRERAARRHLLPVATPDESVSAAGCPFAARCASATDQCRSTSPPMTRLADGRDVACFLFTGCSTRAANQSNNKGEQ